MSGTQFKLKLNDLQWSNWERDFEERLNNPEPFLKSMGEEMLPRIHKRFKDERGPDGKAWARLSPVTVAARLKHNGNTPMTILRNRGHLIGSINYQSSSSSLSIGSGNEVQDYAAIHQFGGQAGRGRKVKIPARPYLGFADEDMAVIEEEAADYFME